MESIITLINKCSYEINIQIKPCVKNQQNRGCPQESYRFCPKRGPLIFLSDSVTLKWRTSGPNRELWIAWGDTTLQGKWVSGSVSATNSSLAVPLLCHAADVYLGTTWLLWAPQDTKAVVPGSEQEMFCFGFLQGFFPDAVNIYSIQTNLRGKSEVMSFFSWEVQGYSSGVDELREEASPDYSPVFLSPSFSISFCCYHMGSLPENEANT